MRSKLLRILVPVLVIAVALIVFIRPADAATPPPVFCGKGGISVDGIGIAKKIECQWFTIWEWSIQKVAHTTSLALGVGQEAPVNYSVNMTGRANATFRILGPIYIRNLTNAPILILAVNDSMGPVTCPVTFPYSLNPGVLIECAADGIVSTMPTQNTVTVIHGAGVASSLPLPLTWNPATNWRTDQCVTVTDSAVGFLGSRCADPVAVTTFRYRYTRMVGPYEAPGDFLVENTATFVTNNSGATGSSSATVSVSVR